VTEAHDQRLTLHLVTHVPAHEPREDDPHYHLFEQVKARMKRQGLWQCVINDDYCGGNVELHHAHIEYSQANSADLDKVNQALGLHLDSDEDFQRWIESPGNLEPLCEVHHRTHFGVHVIPGPLWEPLRYRKYNARPAAEFVTAEEAEKGVTVPVKAGHHAGSEHAETHHTVEKSAAPETTTVAQPRKAVQPRRAVEPKPKKGFFARMFGN
jgi:hypothetical protein